VSKLNDAEAEAAETQTWIYFAVECGYLSKELVVCSRSCATNGVGIG